MDWNKISIAVAIIAGVVLLLVGQAYLIQVQGEKEKAVIEAQKQKELEILKIKNKPRADLDDCLKVADRNYQQDSEYVLECGVKEKTGICDGVTLHMVKEQEDKDIAQCYQIYQLTK